MGFGALAPAYLPRPALSSLYSIKLSPLCHLAVEKEFFKGSVAYSGKIPPTDGHTLCLLCLGETHCTESCGHCLNFSHQTHHDRAARLCTALKEASLCPQRMDEAAASTSSAAAVRSTSAPMSTPPATPTISTLQVAPSTSAPVKKKLASQCASHASAPGSLLRTEKKKHKSKKVKPAQSIQADTVPEQILAFPPQCQQSTLV